MTMPSTDPQKCPRCGGWIPNNETPGKYPGALSRVDNKTEICSDCGTAEALEDWADTLRKERRDTELWSEVFGGGWETWEWWDEYEYLDGAEWDRPGRVRIVCKDPDAPPDVAVTTETVVTMPMIRQALETAIEYQYVDACTGNPIHERMEWDACSSDVILQIAVLGRLVYG